MSLDGPEAYNDSVRGQGTFQKVRKAIFARNCDDGTTVILQMTITRDNAPLLDEYVQSVADWPVDGIAFTFYVPARYDKSAYAWTNLSERDIAVRKVIHLKQRYSQIKANVGTLELMLSEVCLEYTGTNGENCAMKNMLPLYIGENGRFERTFCCYGNDVDCARCGAYAVFNGAYHRSKATSPDRNS